MEFGFYWIIRTSPDGDVTPSRQRPSSYRTQMQLACFLHLLVIRACSPRSSDRQTAEWPASCPGIKSQIDDIFAVIYGSDAYRLSFRADLLQFPATARATHVLHDLSCDSVLKYFWRIFYPSRRRRSPILILFIAASFPISIIRLF